MKSQPLAPEHSRNEYDTRFPADAALGPDRELPADWPRRGRQARWIVVSFCVLAGVCSFGGAAPAAARQAVDLATVLAAVKAPSHAEAVLQSGQSVAVLLPGTPSDEIGIFAAMRVSTSAEAFLARFGDLGVFQRHSAVLILTVALSYLFSALRARR